MQMLPQVVGDAVVRFIHVQQLGDVGISESGSGMEYRLHELVALDFTGGGDRHLAHQCQPVDVRLERTHLVRQCLGQHRDHAAGEIDRIAT